MQVQIQDDDGREVGRGEQGEICVIGPAVFAGYYDNPEANAKSFRDGWFRTGDLGHMDEQGFVYITGRASDMYISGGSNIYPREIEEKILTHPAIAEVAVLGVPDPVWGEIGVAVCVCRPGQRATEAEIADFLGDKIARYKMPKRFFFWEALPKSGYGKVPKRLVTRRAGGARRARLAAGDGVVRRIEQPGHRHARAHRGSKATACASTMTIAAGADAAGGRTPQLCRGGLHQRRRACSTARRCRPSPMSCRRCRRRRSMPPSTARSFGRPGWRASRPAR